MDRPFLCSGLPHSPFSPPFGEKEGPDRPQVVQCNQEDLGCSNRRQSGNLRLGLGDDVVVDGVGGGEDVGKGFQRVRIGFLDAIVNLQKIWMPRAARFAIVTGSTMHLPRGLR